MACDFSWGDVSLCSATVQICIIIIIRFCMEILITGTLQVPSGKDGLINDRTQNDIILCFNGTTPPRQLILRVKVISDRNIDVKFVCLHTLSLPWRLRHFDVSE